MAPDPDRSSSGKPRFTSLIDDAFYAALIRRMDGLVGCTEGSPEEEELARLAAMAEALEEGIGWTQERPALAKIKNPEYERPAGAGGPNWRFTAS